jgi:hypothetical protein
VVWIRSAAEAEALPGSPPLPFVLLLLLLLLLVATAGCAGA